MGALIVGADIGQRRDPTAICVDETETRLGPTGKNEIHHMIRYLERLPLGTDYPRVADRMSEIVAKLYERTKKRPRLFVDATGVGQPIVDVLRQRGVKGEIIACCFTHGDRRTEESGSVRIGKAWLVSRLQALLQSGRVHLPRTGEADALAKELLDYEIRVDENANDKYGAFKVGTHDDLVTALGLASQQDGPPMPFGWMKTPAARVPDNWTEERAMTWVLDLPKA